MEKVEGKRERKSGHEDERVKAKERLSDQELEKERKRAGRE